MVSQYRHQRRDSPTRGRHLTATQPIKKGQLIFVEKPLLSLQTLGNAHEGALVCRYCRAFVGGPELCLKVVSGMTNRDDLGKAVVHCDDISGSTTVLVPCRHKCGELYCSDNCEQAMWEYGGHQLLCTGLLPDPSSNADDKDSHEYLHPLLKFKLHAVHNNEILLMVADLVVTILSLYRKQLEIFHFTQKDSIKSEQVGPLSLPVTLAEILAPYLDFSLTPWWEVATASMISSPLGFIEASKLDKTLRSLCRESSALLRDALIVLAQETHPAYVNGDTSDRILFQRSLLQSIQDCDELFSEQFFGKIIGSFEQNAIGIRARHPLCRDILESSPLRKKCHSELVMCLNNQGLLGNDKANVGEDDYDDDEMEMDGTVERQSITWDEVDHLLATLYIEEEGVGIEDSKAVRADADGEELDENDGDDLDILFTPLDGTAMYQTACKMNHSCDPNVMVRYSCSRIPGGTIGKSRWGRHFPLVLECIAVRDIDAYEELCISYINKTKPLLERQDELLNTYGFRCTCMRCQSELQDNGISLMPDASSQNSIYQVFGEDDETMAEDVSDLGGDLELNGMEALNVVVAKLNENALLHGWGHLPLPIFSNVVSYVVRNGSELVHNLTTSVGTNSVYMEKDLSETIQKCIEALIAREYSTCINIGTTAEEFLLKSFLSYGSWKYSFMQKTYWICALVASVAFAQNLNFRLAISFIDRAFILGLPRVELESFFDYVSYHSKFKSHAYEIFLSINSFGQVVEPHEVSSIIIKYPIVQVLQENVDSSSVIAEARRNRKPIVIRNFAGSWQAITKWNNFTYLVAEHGHRIVPIEVGDMATGMTEKMMSLSSFYEDYLLSHTQTNCPVAYLAQHSLCDQIPELLQDLVMDPELCSIESKINMWIGTKGTYSIT